MAAELTNDGADRALDAITGRAAPAAANCYLHLLEAAPTDSSVLVSGLDPIDAAGYSAQQVTFSAPEAGSGGYAGKRVIVNSGDVEFTFSADPENVTYAALSLGDGSGTDQVTYWFDGLSIDVGADDTIRIPAGDLIIALD